MSNFKRISAIVIIFIMVLSLAACRTKDESALVFGNLSAEKGDLDAGRADVRSAIYLIYCIQADGEFKQEVNDRIQASSTVSGEINFEKEKLDKKDYKTWVKEKAFEYSAEFAKVELEFKKLGLKLSDEKLQQSDYYANNYWEGSQYQQGYKQVYELNGVNKSSFLEYWTNSYKREAIFDHYYGKGGKKAISAADVTKGLNENFVLANTINVSFKDESGNDISAEDKAKAKKQLDEYAKKLNNGSTFAQIKAEYDKANNPQPETTTAATTTAVTTTTAATTKSATTTATTAATTVATTEEKKLEAKDPNATVYYGPKTANPDSYFEEIHKLAVGTVKVIEFSDSYMLVVRQDITKDPYYIENFDAQVRRVLKGDEFDKQINKDALELDVKRNTGAIDYYSPKKIRYTTKAR